MAGWILCPLVYLLALSFYKTGWKLRANYWFLFYHIMCISHDSGQLFQGTCGGCSFWRGWWGAGVAIVRSWHQSGRLQQRTWRAKWNLAKWIVMLKRYFQISPLPLVVVSLGNIVATHFEWESLFAFGRTTVTLINWAGPYNVAWTRSLARFDNLF
jgi:hypothetical protein